MAENSRRCPSRRAVLEERGDHRQEAHVGHPVGLVEHDDLDLVEAGSAAVDEVGEPTRRGDDDVDAALQVVHLLADRQTAGDEQELDPDAARDRLERVDDLHGELAGRDEHEAERAVRRDRAASEPRQHRQAERERLAGAGLRRGRGRRGRRPRRRPSRTGSGTAW